MECGEVVVVDFVVVLQGDVFGFDVDVFVEVVIWYVFGEVMYVVLCVFYVGLDDDVDVVEVFVM